MDFFEFLFPKYCIGCGERESERLLCDECSPLFFVCTETPCIDWGANNSYLFENIKKNPHLCKEWLTSILILFLGHQKYAAVDTVVVDKKGPLWGPCKSIVEQFNLKLQSTRKGWSIFKRKKYSKKVMLLIEVGFESHNLDLWGIPQKLLYLRLFSKP